MNSKRVLWCLVFAMLGSTLLTTACASCAVGMVHGRKIGGAATEKFHRDWSNSDWDAIVHYCDPAMFENTPEPKLRKFFTAVHDKLGNEQSATEGGWRTNATTNGTFYMVSVNTHFDKGTGTETFTWKIIGDEAKLVGWHINSNALLDPSLTQ
jgi:Protein of unknown function (DUF3887)